MTTETDAWTDLEDRFARALTAWGFALDMQDAAPYARSVVRNLKADGWRAPARRAYRGRRADPQAVAAYAEQCRAAIRRQPVA